MHDPTSSYDREGGREGGYSLGLTKVYFTAHKIHDMALNSEHVGAGGGRDEGWGLRHFCFKYNFGVFGDFVSLFLSQGVR